MLRRVNLIPPSERQRTQADAGMLLLVVVAVVVVAGIAFSYVYFNGTLSDKRREFADLQTETAQVQNQLNALAQYERLQEDREAAEHVTAHIYARRTLLSQTLGDFSLVIPEESWLQKLDITSPEIPPLKGGAEKAELSQGSYSVAGQTYTFEDVSKTMVRFEQIPSLTSVVLDRAANADRAGATEIKDFTIGGGVKNTQPEDTPLPLSQVQVTP